MDDGLLGSGRLAGTAEFLIGAATGYVGAIKPNIIRDVTSVKLYYMARFWGDIHEGAVNLAAAIVSDGQQGSSGCPSIQG